MSPTIAPDAVHALTVAGTSAGVIMGTAAYMSPEQARGRPVDRRTDIWAFGVVVFRMLTGGAIFEGETVTEQTKDVLREVDEALASAGTDKSKILQAIIWLSDMSTFAEMNSVWDQWVDKANPPARATGEAKLAAPQYKVEIIITAAAD